MKSATEAGQQAPALIDGYGADWAKVSLGPLAATLLVTGSDLSGPIDSMKEVKAKAAELVADKDKLMALVKAGAAAVAQRSPAEASAYKATVLKVAQAHGGSSQGRRLARHWRQADQR